MCIICRGSQCNVDRCHCYRLACNHYLHRKCIHAFNTLTKDINKILLCPFCNEDIIIYSSIDEVCLANQNSLEIQVLNQKLNEKDKELIKLKDKIEILNQKCGRYDILLQKILMLLRKLM